MSFNGAPIHFVGAEFGDQRHVCAFFHSPEEKYRALFPFVKDGFDRGDRAFHVIDPDRRKEHLERLDPKALIRRGQNPAVSSRCAVGTRPILIHLVISTGIA